MFQLQFNGKMALSDIQRLPTYQRKWFIQRTQKEIEAMNKAMKDSKHK